MTPRLAVSLAWAAVTFIIQVFFLFLPPTSLFSSFSSTLETVQVVQLPWSAIQQTVQAGVEGCTLQCRNGLFFFFLCVRTSASALSKFWEIGGLLSHFVKWTTRVTLKSSRLVCVIILKANSSDTLPASSGTGLDLHSIQLQIQFIYPGKTICASKPGWYIRNGIFYNCSAHLTRIITDKRHKQTKMHKPSHLVTSGFSFWKLEKKSKSFTLEISSGKKNNFSVCFWKKK